MRTPFLVVRGSLRSGAGSSRSTAPWAEPRPTAPGKIWAGPGKLAPAGGPAAALVCRKVCYARRLGEPGAGRLACVHARSPAKKSSRRKPLSPYIMSDVYVVVHLATTCDDSAVYVPRDTCELLELSWATVDAKTLQILPRQSVLVKPTNTPVTATCQQRYNLKWDDVKAGFLFKDAIAEFDKRLMPAVAGKEFSFVVVDLHGLRVLLPREARDKSVVLPVYLQHPRVFDLANEYLKWQSTHPEAMSYPASSLTNIITALDVEVPPGWTEDAAGDLLLTVGVYAQVLLQLVKKSLPLDQHPLVLTKPYDSAHDAKLFLAERSKILYLSNLPPETTQSELESWFTQYGGRPIAFWTLKNVDADAKSQAKARGASGFAVFSKHEEAADSLYLNGRVLNDRVVEVQASSTRVLDRASDLLTPFPPLKNRPRPGDWTCPSCGFSNFQRRIACFRCSFPATSAVAIQEQMYPGSGAGAGAQDGAGPTNMRRSKTDDKQLSPAYGGYQDHYLNPHHSLKNGSGYNSGYNHGYSHGHSGGNGQRAHYGNSVPFRAGDWKCANESCLYHNFAKNVCCLKCGGARPSSVNSNHHNSSNASNASNTNNSGNHGYAGATSVSASATGSIHSANPAAAAIAAATASGQPLTLNDSFPNLHLPHPHQSRQGSQTGSSPSPGHSNGIYSNISQLQQFPYELQGKQSGSAHLPQHLAFLQGQGNSQQSNRGKAQSSTGAPGLYVQKQGYQYNNPSGNNVNLLSNQISSLSLHNSGA